MLDGRVKYQLFVPNIVHIGDPTASITIILNNLGNHLLQLKSVQCTWVEVYTFEEPGRSPVSREHTMAKVLKLQDAFPTATDEVTQKFAIPQTEAAPDCDHRAVAPNVHPLLKAYGGSACITHEVRIKVEYKLGRQVNLMLDGILARIPFNNVVHTGSGAIIKAKHGVSSSGTRMGRLSVMSGSSSSAGSISSPTTPRAGSIAPSSYGLPEEARYRQWHLEPVPQYLWPTLCHQLRSTHPPLLHPTLPLARRALPRPLLDIRWRGRPQVLWCQMLLAWKGGLRIPVLCRQHSLPTWTYLHRLPMTLDHLLTTLARPFL
ncbi:hypothetical protein BC829DRAFT_3163 [Chytridium lagenaria]|nr:hypothetical protein BC829DRAFT_3163 [Chytridium lagenaria]